MTDKLKDDSYFTLGMGYEKYIYKVMALTIDGENYYDVVPIAPVTCRIVRPFPQFKRNNWKTIQEMEKWFRANFNGFRIVEPERMRIEVLNRRSGERRKK